MISFTPYVSVNPSLAPVVEKDASGNLKGTIVGLRNNENKSSSAESLFDYDKIKNLVADLLEINSAGALRESERNRAFQQESADRAMTFEAQQAALDRLFQQTSADKAMEFSRSEAQAQRDYEERMANTAYQRAMADLKEAGLNPILAYAHPANVPSGVAARSSSASGSRASGRSASGSQAQVDSASDILSVFLNGIASMIGSAGKLISALNPSVPSPQVTNYIEKTVRSKGTITKVRNYSYS